MIELFNVRAGYNEADVIHDITFQGRAGENICILGPNGCGKTTLLKTIGGLIPYGGNILLDQKEIKHYKRSELAKKVSFLSQISLIYFPYTVYETVLLGRYAQQKAGILHFYTKEDIEITKECIRKVGLEGEHERLITSLSGGQLQRVFLARTMAQNPDIILLDEPTNHLDLRYQIELIDYLKKWARENNKTTIGVFHDMNLAMELGDQFIILKEGNMVVSGDLKKITPELLEYTFEIKVKEYMVGALNKWKGIG